MIVLASLVPLCFAGWLVWQSMRGDTEDEGSGSPPVKPGPSASGTAGRDGDEQGRPGGEGTGDGDDADGGAREPLAGRTVVLDPGHNPTNRKHPTEINRQVDIGTNKKECDTTGTETNSGYAEAEFTLDLARRVRTELRARGATVRLTQDGDRPWGPCVDERAEIGNEAKADAVVSLHADGAAQGGHGFHVIVPASVRAGGADTSAISAPSRRLGISLAAAFDEVEGARRSNYISAEEGYVTRDDLGGLNLSKVPKVFLECGNMRDAGDAGLFTDAKWRGRAADGIARGIADFLTGKR